MAARQTRRKGFTYPYPRPAVTVDVAVFAAIPPARDTIPELKVLLIQRGRDPHAGRWALPGGFVDEMEDLPAAMLRELDEETGLHAQPGPQVGAYGTPGRDPRGHTISVAYLAWLSGGPAPVAGMDDAVDARWHNARKPPRLAFDHRDILRDAVAMLERRCGETGPTARWVQLLPQRFTVADAVELHSSASGIPASPSLNACMRRALRSHRAVRSLATAGRTLRFRRLD